MRKNFMLSLTALAALPMAGFADATWSVPADKTHTEEWATEGTDLSTSGDEQIFGIGAGVSRTIELVKGTYVVSVERLANAEFTICVGDKEYHSGEEFTLTADKNDVTLKVTRKNAGEDGKEVFAVGGISVKLIFNFEAAKNTLNYNLRIIAPLPATEAEQDFWQKEIANSTTKADIQARIDALANGDKAAYELYVKEELYKETSKIQAAINEFDALIQKCNQYRSDYEEVLDKISGMESDLAALTAKVAQEGTASQFAKDTYKSDVSQLEADIADFKTSFNYTTKQIFATKTKQEWLNEIEKLNAETGEKTGYKAQIAALSDKIADADADAAAFAEVTTAIEKATANYYAYKTALEFAGDEYATLRKKASAKLDQAYVPVVKQKDVACTLGYRNQKDTDLTKITDAETAMKGVKSTFVDYYTTIEGEFAKVAVYVASVEKYKKAIADDNLTDIYQYAKAAEDEIKKAKDALEAAMTAISDASGLGTLPANYNALQNAVDYLEVNYLLASADSAFTAAQTAVEGMVKGKYDEASYWTAKVASIQSTLDAFKAYADDVKVTNKTVVTAIYFKNLESGVESGSICNYKADAEAAYNQYLAVTAAIADWTEKYNAVDFVTNPTVPFESTTYGDALRAAKADIDDNQKALDAAVAVAKQNTTATSTAHADAMGALTALDTTTYPAIFSASKADYEAAKNAHELPQTIASANSLAAEVNTLAAAVLAKLKDAYTAYKGEDKAAEYGNRYEKEIWGSEANPNVAEKNFWGIRQVYYNIPGVVQSGDDKGTYTAVMTPSDATYEVAMKNITDLRDVRSTLAKIDKDVDDLNTLATQIKADFDKNNQAHAAFVTACTTARTNAENITAKNSDGSRVEEFKALKKDITDRLNALEDRLGPSKANETFVADRDKDETGFKATLDAINADITKHIAAAEASTANFQAKEDLLAQIKADLYEADGTTKKTVAPLAEINNVSNPGHTHFAGVVTQLATDIATLETNVNTKYSEHKASEYKEEATKEITRIQNAIAAATTDCKANDDNYDTLIETGKKVEEYYIKIYYKISETDKTSKKQEWLDDLAAIETVSQDAIDASFAAGELSKDLKYQEYDDLYSVRKAAIENINLSWIDPSCYLKNVADKNNAEFDKVKDAYKAAVDVYLDAIAGLKPFLDYKGDDQRWNVDVAKHNAKIFNLKKDLDAAYAEATTKHGDMAKANGALTPETVEKAQYFDGSAWYSKTTDAQGELQEDGSIYDARVAISTAYKTAIDALNADTKTQLTNAIYAVETAVNTAIRGINTSMYAVYQGDGTQTAREKFFATVDAELKAVNDLLVQDQLAVNYLNSKGKDKDYDKQIEAIKTTTLPNALNALAEAQYNDWIADKNAKHTELYYAAYEGADKGLFDMYPAIAENYKAAYETAEETLNEYLTSLGTDFTPTYGTDENGVNRMDDLYSYFIDFKSNNGYKEFKNAIGTYKDSEAAYEKFIKGTEAAAGDTYINEVQRIIDNEAKTYAPDFIVAADTIAGVQARLDALVADANTFRATYGMATHYPTLLSQLRTVKAAAKGLMADINQAEYDELVFQLANLKSDYNQALIEEDKESKDMNAYHEKILGYETALTRANFDMSDTKKDAEEETAPAVVPFHTYDKLLAIQDSIIADRNELAGVRVDGIYKALVANLNGLTDRYKTMAENYAKLYTYQQNAIALKADKSGELLASVDASNANHWILIEEKSLKDRIDSWTDYLDDMEPEVATALDVHDTDAEARQRLQTELEDCQTYVDNMLNNELFKLFDVKSYWKHSTYKSNYERFVQNNADIYSDPESDGQLKTENSKLGYIDWHNNNIKNCERWIYNQEVSLRYTSNTEEYTCVNTALDNLNGLLKNENILYRDTHDASYNELDRKAQAAWTFFNNIRWNGNTYYTYVDIDGNDIAYTSYDHQAFVTEVVPAVIKRIESILADAETLKANIEENTYVPGDLSGDKKVSLADFATLQSIILSKPEVDDEVQKAAADLNKDGFVDISDLMLLVRQILTPTAPAPARVRVAIPHATTNDAVSVIVEGEGVHQRIGIMLDAEQAYAGCQMDITLPEGVTLAEETTGEMAGALSLLSNDLENGSHRILLSSVEGLTMATGNGALLWLDVNVDHNYNGEGIGLSNVLFANSFGRAFELSVAAGETTGLSNVSMTQEVKEKIYNVGGILMDGLKRGVNIIRGNDGSSKKIIVK